MTTHLFPKGNSRFIPTLGTLHSQRGNQLNIIYRFVMPIITAIAISSAYIPFV